MNTLFRKAEARDIPAIAAIYDKILSSDSPTGWKRGVYPTEETAKASLIADDLFVLEYSGVIAGSGRINREQVKEYADCSWHDNAPEDHVMVLHTLTIDPDFSGKGLASCFVRHYEAYARAQSCPYLRMDTNVINLPARSLYKKLGYTEAGIVDSFFNGIPDVKLVCLEKTLEERNA